MKNKNSLNHNEANPASHGKSVINTSSTYPSDIPLLKSLRLTPFTDIPENKEHFVGEITFESGSVVKIWVCPAPALLFWKFEVFVAESNKTINVSTGSGALEKFWNTIKLIAEDMLDIR